MLCGLLCLSAPLSAQVRLDLDGRGGHFGPVSWDAFRLSRNVGPDGSSTVELSFQEVLGLPGLPAGAVSMLCGKFSWTETGLVCSKGRLRLPEDWLVLDGAIDISLEPAAAGGYRIVLDHPKLEAIADWSVGEGLRIALKRMESTVLQPVLAAQLGVSALGGEISGQMMISDQNLDLDMELHDHFFDTRDGLAAGDGLDVELSLSGRTDAVDYELSLRQTDGELLLGPVYLAPPEEPVFLESRLSLAEGNQISLTGLSFTDPGSVSLAGSATIDTRDGGWRLKGLTVEAFEFDLEGLWPRWLDGPAAGVGFPGLEASGNVSGSLLWRSEEKAQVDITARGLGLRDPRERLSVQGVDLALSGTDQLARLDLSWESLGLLGLVLGPSQARLHLDDIGMRLLDPVRMALLDGAVVVDGLAWLNVSDLESKLVLDARIEPVDLATLTGTLGLPELGGQLAGRFPGVTYSDQRLAFTGGIEIDAFSGRIGIDELVVERLFGTAPALAAQVELERLDLLELTGAFGFGRMEGLASGRVHNLRLLDWRPVAMDARLYTHLDAPRRRISQRAVDNLSSLGGGGSAVISGTVLRLFEDFPYKQAGLACLLDNNICQIDGIGPHESGGFLIVEGRGLPRLDVVGHRRLVDWPRLTRQLIGMMEAESAESAGDHGGSTPGTVQ